MKLHTLRTVLKLMRLRADQSALGARQAKARWQEAQSFSEQVRDYARDYDQGFVKVASQGDSALLLQERAQFNARLYSTALEQEEQLKPLAQKASAAMQQAVESHAKAKAMNRFVKDRQLLLMQHAQQREDKESEDILQARLGKP